MFPVNESFEYLEMPGYFNPDGTYYKVLAKCGHVGKGYYFEGKFYVPAENGKMAAKKVRQFPRVKHDYSDAIISVTKVSFEEFLEGRNREYCRPYYRCVSKQEQEMFWEDTLKDIYLDDHCSDLESKGKWNKKRCLKKIYNIDPMYSELKGYRGNIDCNADLHMWA